MDTHKPFRALPKKEPSKRMSVVRRPPSALPPPLPPLPNPPVRPLATPPPSVTAPAPEPLVSAPTAPTVSAPVKLEDPGTAALLADLSDSSFDGLLTSKNSLRRLFDKLGGGRGPGKHRLQRLLEHLRLVYQLRVVVQLEQLKQRKRLNQAQLNKLIVSAYKALGFTVLTVIVLGLVTYMGANLFYWLSSSWLEPTVVSATDERVLQLSAKLAEQSSTRDKLKADLADAERVIQMHQDFLENAQQALADDLADRRRQLQRLQALNKNYASTRTQIRSASTVYSGMSRRRIAAEYGARLIDREAAVSGAFQLSQIAHGNLSLAEKEVELAKRTGELERETEALAAVLSQQPAGGKKSYEVLRILQDLKRAQVEAAKARDNRDALKRSLERYDNMVATITNSPWLKAVEQKATIAFVPYENLANMKKGAPLYGCALGLFFCSKVGEVVDVLGGELTFKHPLHNQMVRGQSVQIALTDPRAAQRKVLFAGGRPILF